MARNLLKTEDTDGSQRTSEDISEMLIGRQLDAFAPNRGRRPRPGCLPSYLLISSSICFRRRPFTLV